MCFAYLWVAYFICHPASRYRILLGTVNGCFSNMHPPLSTPPWSPHEDMNGEEQSIIRDWIGSRVRQGNPNPPPPGKMQATCVGPMLLLKCHKVCIHQCKMPCASAGSYSDTAVLKTTADKPPLCWLGSASPGAFWCGGVGGEKAGGEQNEVEGGHSGGPLWHAWGRSLIQATTA